MIKRQIEQQVHHKAKRKKNSLNEIQNELTRLESENNAIIDKIATSTSEFVQKGLEKRIEINHSKIKQSKEEIKSIGEINNILDKIDSVCDVLYNPCPIWRGETIEKQQMFLSLVFSKKIPIDFSTRTY